MTAQALTLNPNTLWCRAIVDTLIGLGVTEIVTSPGTRSAALVSALRERPECRLHVITDERAAGFFALGLARSLRRPAAVCVTSGSAVANLVPALCEAYANAAPLVALTCDRPRSLRGAGQPQTTKQAEFCAPVTMKVVDLSDPDPSPDGLARVVEAVAGIAIHLRDDGERGPVQINIPLSGRMTSVDGAHGWGAQAAHGACARETRVQAPRTSTVDVSALAESLGLKPNLKGLIVVGPDEDLPAEAIGNFAARTGYPMILDAPGGLRGRNLPGRIAEADFLTTRREIAALKPDLLIRIGPAPVSAALQQYLGSSRAPVLRIDRRAVGADYLNAKFHFVPLHDHAAMAAIAERLATGDPAWRECWLGHAESCRHALPGALAAGGWSEIKVAGAALSHSGFDFVHLANSLAIRLGNMLVRCDDSRRPIYANRGVAGIDGTIGTFLGETAGSHRPGLLLIGDLAAVHDLSSLETCLHTPYRGAIVVMNNDGAGLFDLLPVRSTPAYRPYIRHSAGLNFEHIARAFGLDFDRCRSSDELHAALDAATDERSGLRLIEAVVEPGAIAGELRDFLRQLTGSADIGSLGRLKPLSVAAAAEG